MSIPRQEAGMEVRGLIGLVLIAVIIGLYFVLGYYGQGFVFRKDGKLDRDRVLVVICSVIYFVIVMVFTRLESDPNSKMSTLDRGMFTFFSGFFSALLGVALSSSFSTKKPD